MIMTRILDEIMDHKGDFEILEFIVGKRKNDYSTSKIEIIGENQEHLNTILREVFRLGATTPETPEVQYEPAPSDKVLPDNFYSTTNHPTSIYLDGEWRQVKDLMMDKQIILDPSRKEAHSSPIGQVKKGDLVVVGEKGIRIKPPERPRGGVGIFEFMTSDVSPEKPTTAIIKEIARDLHKTMENGGRIVVVAGPAVIHTGAAPYLAKMIQLGYVQALLTGNALAVHDVEYALFDTSLGVELDKGGKVKEPRNHIAAINEINKAGSMKSMIENGTLTKGIFYQMITNNLPFALAGSIRDDGPIPEVITCSMEAQKQYKVLVKDADFVIMFASTLHSIAVGNMLTSDVKIV